MTKSQQITDPKLLAKVRKLIRQEHAAYIPNGDRCVEPGCSCSKTWMEDGDPVSGPFRDPPVRCSSFEKLVLPLDPGLQEAYWAHLETGQEIKHRRCAWPGCRREAGAINAKYCGPHALLSMKRSKREHARRRRAAQRGRE